MVFETWYVTTFRSPTLSGPVDYRQGIPHVTRTFFNLINSNTPHGKFLYRGVLLQTFNGDLKVTDVTCSMNWLRNVSTRFVRLFVTVPRVSDERLWSCSIPFKGVEMTTDRCSCYRRQSIHLSPLICRRLSLVFINLNRTIFF